MSPHLSVRKRETKSGITVTKKLTLLSYGAIAGLLSTMAISGIILLVEKATSLPVGTFYLIMANAIAGSQEFTMQMIITGFALHLAAGTILGLIIAVPMTMSSKKYSQIIIRFAPLYGLLFGIMLWLVFFVPITAFIVKPLLQSIDTDEIVIKQQLPVGKVYQMSAAHLLNEIDKITIGAISFNMLYGLIVATTTKSLLDTKYKKSQSV